MNAKDTMYLLEDVKNLSDKDLYERLFESWNITNEKIEVWGELRDSQDEKPARIYRTRTLHDNQEIRYPLKVRYDVDSGIYIKPRDAKLLLNGKHNVWVKCELELSSLFEREKYTNPFDLSAKKGTAQILVSLPLIDTTDVADTTDILSNEEASYITEAIYDIHFKAAAMQSAENQAKNVIELDSVERKRAEISSALNKLNQSNTELQTTQDSLQSDVLSKQRELFVLQQRYQNIEQEMAKKIEQLKTYISGKALFLKQLEFIDDDVFDGLSFNASLPQDISEMVSFVDVFKSDYKQAVSYIQAYLKNRDVFYSRHVVENFLTLIRSNDLIILAGESGSGKTNLVQSFAQAVGGVSKIIPVKPNWTSSEDLLGYYNPLEKKYLATPFLEALIEAQQNPRVPYFICLDEMNLARVEFYFADFLSKMETRDSTPEIQLYSDDESAHVLAELRAVVSIISNAKVKYSKEGIVDFVKLMQDQDINAEMKRAFGFGDRDSLIKYHGDIRRMLAGIMNTPSTIQIPPNVRIIGAINIDETTHYLSPKILDRAHIMKFKSPLLSDWEMNFSEIESYGFDDASKPLHFEIEALGVRTSYPKFEHKNSFCELFISLNREFFNPLGVDFGMRTIRQGMHYMALFSELNDNPDQAINNFILHKVLPKFTFDGNKQSGQENKLNLIDKVMLPRIESVVLNHTSIADEFSCVVALREIISDAKSNDGVVNYWA